MRLPDDYTTRRRSHVKALEIDLSVTLFPDLRAFCSRRSTSLVDYHSPATPAHRDAIDASVLPFDTGNFGAAMKKRIAIALQLQRRVRGRFTTVPACSSISRLLATAWKSSACRSPCCVRTHRRSCVARVTKRSPGSRARYRNSTASSFSSSLAFTERGRGSSYRRVLTLLKAAKSAVITIHGFDRI